MVRPSRWTLFAVRGALRRLMFPLSRVSPPSPREPAAGEVARWRKVMDLAAIKEKLAGYRRPVYFPQAPICDFEPDRSKFAGVPWIDAANPWPARPRT